MAQESGHVVMQTPAPYMGDPFLSASAGKIWTIDFKQAFTQRSILFFIKGSIIYEKVLCVKKLMM